MSVHEILRLLNSFSAVIYKSIIIIIYYIYFLIIICKLNFKLNKYWLIVIELEQRDTQHDFFRIYKLKQTITTLMQNQNSKNIYFSKLNALFDELFNYKNLKIVIE